MFRVVLKNEAELLDRTSYLSERFKFVSLKHGQGHFCQLALFVFQVTNLGQKRQWKAKELVYEGCLLV